MEEIDIKAAKADIESTSDLLERAPKPSDGGTHVSETEEEKKYGKSIG